MGGTALAITVGLALAVGPAWAADPCDLAFWQGAREEATGKARSRDLPPPGEWRVSRRDAEARVSEACGIGVIEAPLAAVREVIDAAADFDDFMPRVLKSEVEPVSPGVYLNRQVLDMPFPAGDRRYTVRVVTGAVETRGGTGWQACWTYVAGSGNVRDTRGAWTLIPQGPERTVVVYRLLSDPGGRLPGWVVDYAAPRALRRVLASVRDRVLSRE